MNKKIIFLILVLFSFSAFVVSCDSGGGEDIHTHEYIENVYSPTCDSLGYKEKVCTVCGNIEKSDYVNYKEHTAGAWSVINAETCVSGEIKQKCCTSCGKVMETEIGEAEGHNYVADQIFFATCTEQGYILHTCKKCGDTYRDNYTAVTSHAESDWIVTATATCKSAGRMEKVCTLCGKILNVDGIGVTEHSYIAVSSVAPTAENGGGYTNYECMICANTYKGEYAPASSGELSAGQIYELIKDSTVEIIAYDKHGKRYYMGTGFFITDSGELVTNYHVVQGAFSLKVTTSEGNSYTVASVIGYDSSQDIAILKINAGETPYIKISSDEVKTGDTVYALGSSMGYNDSFSSGIVSNVSRTVNGRDCIQFTAPISSGNSGGPLVNGKGELIGINAMSTVDGQNINFAINAQRINRVPRNYNKSVSQLYYDKLEENAFEVLKMYIAINHTGYDGENYFISSVTEETDESYGMEMLFFYNSKEDYIGLQLNLLTENAYKYSIQIEIPDVRTAYSVSMYDYSMSQITIRAVAIGNKTLGTYENTFDEAIIVDTIRYPVSSEDGRTQDLAQQLFYASYKSIVGQLYILLSESETGLTLSHFNLMLPVA